MKVYTKQEVLDEWIAISAFPFILPVVEKFELNQLTILQAYKEIDIVANKYHYMNLPLYEKFNLAYFIRNNKFPETMITIPHKAQQGKAFQDGICMLSSFEYTNTVILVNDRFESRRV